MKLEEFRRMLQGGEVRQDVDHDSGIALAREHEGSIDECEACPCCELVSGHFRCKASSRTIPRDSSSDPRIPEWCQLGENDDRASEFISKVVSGEIHLPGFGKLGEIKELVEVLDESTLPGIKLFDAHTHTTGVGPAIPPGAVVREVEYKPGSIFEQAEIGYEAPLLPIVTDVGVAFEEGELALEIETTGEHFRVLIPKGSHGGEVIERAKELIGSPWPGSEELLLVRLGLRVPAKVKVENEFTRVVKMFEEWGIQRCEDCPYCDPDVSEDGYPRFTCKHINRKWTRYQSWKELPFPAHCPVMRVKKHEEEKAKEEVHPPRWSSAIDKSWL